MDRRSFAKSLMAALAALVAPAAAAGAARKQTERVLNVGADLQSVAFAVAGKGPWPDLPRYSGPGQGAFWLPGDLGQVVQVLEELGDDALVVSPTSTREVPVQSACAKVSSRVVMNRNKNVVCLEGSVTSLFTGDTGLIVGERDGSAVVRLDEGPTVVLEKHVFERGFASAFLTQHTAVPIAIVPVLAARHPGAPLVASTRGTKMLVFVGPHPSTEF